MKLEFNMDIDDRSKVMNYTPGTLSQRLPFFVQSGG
jgi:hypothetical protein